MPETPGQLIRFASRKVLIPIGNDQNRRPHLRHIGIGKAGQQTGGVDSGNVLHLARRGHQELERFARRVVHHDIYHQRRLGQCLHGLKLLFQQHAQQLCRLQPALLLIDVRAGTIGQGQIAVVDLLLRQVAMQVEGDDDRKIRP